jgi:hypothetical protein
MAIEGNQREFTLNESTRLVLMKSADDLTQRDMDVFFAAYGRYPQGGTVAEDNGKVLRAAFDARWVAEFTTPRGPIKDAMAVNDAQPWAVRWAAMQIDLVIGKAREIPNG